MIPHPKKRFMPDFYDCSKRVSMTMPAGPVGLSERVTLSPGSQRKEHEFYAEKKSHTLHTLSLNPKREESFDGMTSEKMKIKTRPKALA